MLMELVNNDKVNLARIGLDLLRNWKIMSCRDRDSDMSSFRISDNLKLNSADVESQRVNFSVGLNEMENI